jgi:hypothetical protein
MRRKRPATIPNGDVNDAGAEIGDLIGCMELQLQVRKTFASFGETGDEPVAEEGWR